MRLLLDTHALLWWLFDDPKLPGSARQWIADAQNQALVSAASFPHPHRDPFDRMIAAQSRIENLPIVGRDDALIPFGVQLLW